MTVLASFPAKDDAPIIRFTPSPDVAALLHTLLDVYERRAPSQPFPSAEGREGSQAGVGRGSRAIRFNLDALTLPAYHSQFDPDPRQITNHQLQELEQIGLVRLDWIPGETGHLLSAVTLVPARVDALFPLLNRIPVASRRARLTDLLLGERFRFKDWRLRAIQHTLVQLKADKSPAPFSLAAGEFNRDLLTALAALDEVREETPYRVFSVRVFNDSKRFDELMGAVAALARRHQPEWKGLSNDEILRELNLVANPGHLYLHGPWRLVDETGQVMSLGEFRPSAGIPASQAAKLRRVAIDAPGVMCVENPTSFYELIRNTQYAIAALCLWGNPSPACRHLLRCLPEDTPLLVWADIDYGGLSILAQLREQVNDRTAPYRMDVETLEAHAQWARPLTPGNARNLARLAHRPSLADMRPLIGHLLQRGLKLEQEAITPI